MRRIVMILIILVMSQVVYSQETTPEDNATVVQTLTMLELTEFIDHSLSSPFDVFSYQFTLPENWQLDSEIRAELHIDSIFNTNAPTVSLLQIHFNDVYLNTFPITESGRQVLDLVIPEEALIPYLDTRRHELLLIFDAEQACEQSSLIMVDNTSNFVFNYEEVEAPLSLAELPSPIHNSSFDERPALLIIPDTPTSDTLESAFITMSAFGDMTDEELDLTLVQEADLTAELLASHHLIYVGELGSFDTLGDFDGIISDNALTDDDGVLQIIRHPDDSLLSILLVSGLSETGVGKAAYALNYGQIVTYETSDVAIIEGISPEVEQVSTSTVTTFEDLDYPTQVIYGPRFTTEFLFFMVQNASQLTEDTSLQLALSHSTLMDYSASGFSIKLNGEPIGSINLSEQTAQLTTYDIRLPVASIVSGINELSFDINLRSFDPCSHSSTRQNWVSIHGDSSITLPASETETNLTRPIVTNLREFPAPFNFAPTLETTVFVLDADTDVTWASASDLAYHLGNRAREAGLRYEVLFADEVTSEVLENSNLIILSNHQDNSVIDQLNTALAEQNAGNPTLLRVDLQRVDYRVSEDRDTAYIQFLISPWNQDRSIISIFSETEQGHDSAVQSLTTDTIRRTLIGNFALIQGEQIVTDNIRFLSTTLEEIGTEVPNTPSESLVLDDRNRLIIFGAVFSVLIVIIAIVWGIMRRR